MISPMNTRRLPPELAGDHHRFDPFMAGSRSGLLYAHGDFALAGVGEAGRIPIERPDGAAQAQAMLSVLTGADEVDVPGSGAVAFGAFPFDRSAPGELIVPEVVLGRGPEGRRWLTTSEDMTDAEAVERLEASALDADRRAAATQATSYTLTSPMTPEVWRDAVVGGALEHIRSGDVEKVVMARELRLETDQPVDTAAVLERLRQSFRAAILFSIDGFIGASPELLAGRSNDIVRAHPLAGTAPRSSDPEADARLAAGLLASDKNRWEHRITIDWLLDTLLPFCSYVDAEPEPSIVTLANVHHLGTRVEGRLSSPPASILELVAALHPTPAVGGNPQGRALEIISELEGLERGRYAGPAGWVDGAGNGAFAVALRSAEVSGTSARFCAGVGVVADSDPEAELAETRSKFQAMLSALVRP
ncbi:MAG: isochorismate synthase [Acidimicrobiales bacterium]